MAVLISSSSEFFSLITDKVIPFIFDLFSLLCSHWFFVVCFAVFVVSVVLDVFLEFVDLDVERHNYWQFWK